MIIIKQHQHQLHHQLQLRHGFAESALSTEHLGDVVAGDGFDTEAPDLFLGVFECVEEFGGVWTGLEPESIYRISRDLADERIPLFSDLNVGGGGIAFWR